jgi:hypothetical protein
VAIALVGVVTWGSVVGSMLPFALRRLGFDPATSSAPFVATLVDVTGLMIYFTVATLVLGTPAPAEPQTDALNSGHDIVALSVPAPLADGSPGVMATPIAHELGHHVSDWLALSLEAAPFPPLHAPFPQ